MNLLSLVSTIISIVSICLSLGVLGNWLFDLPWLNIFSDRSTLFVGTLLGSILAVVSLVLTPENETVARKRSAVEQALKISKAKYKAIIEDQAELICRHRQDTTVTYVNQAFCRYFGIERDQIVDRQYTPVVYEPDRIKVKQLVGSMNQENPTITIENRVVAQGKVRWTQWNNRMIFDSQGNFIEYQSVGRDITTLKETETKLKESEEKFRRAFEDAATGMALVAPDGAFIQVNRSLCEIVGYSETELLNKSFQQITHPQDLDLDLDYVKQMLAGTIRTYQMQKRYYHQQGYIVWVLLSVSLVRDVEGQPKYFISQIRNINQRKLAEDKLNDLVAELARSNQELDEFASIISHDLISPLRKQLILIDLLKEESGKVFGDKNELYFNKIIGYSNRMENLIRSFLAYARLTTQTQPFTILALDEVVADILYELQPEIAQVNACIEVTRLPKIKGDRLQMRQLFFNLLQNALKFRNHEQPPQIKISAQTTEDWHQITVSDNGIGFEPEQKSKIFHPFHRLHSFNKYQGTGLGLAICDKIVKRHQGKISAQSQPQQGATFTIWLLNT